MGLSPKIDSELRLGLGFGLETRMRFINPKTDFAFKKIFGSIQSKPILISFLNAVLYHNPVVVDLEILDPYLAPKLQGLKDTYVDVRALLHNGRHVIIEMQVLNVPGFEKRILYNAAKTYSTQLIPSEDYTRLNGVIALTITDFVMFPEWPEVQSAFLLKERKQLADYAEGDFELVFVELPKFQKSLEKLESVGDKWLYFLKETPDLQMVPEELGAVKEIQEAFRIANRANLSKEELDAEEKRAMWLNDQRSLESRVLAKGIAEGLVKGKEEGIMEGIAKGKAQGKAQGRAEGKAEGERLARRELAKGLLDKLSEDEIARLTGLPLSEIQAMRT